MGNGGKRDEGERGMRGERGKGVKERGEGSEGERGKGVKGSSGSMRGRRWVEERWLVEEVLVERNRGRRSGSEGEMKRERGRRGKEEARGEGRIETSGEEGRGGGIGSEPRLRVCPRANTLLMLEK